MVKDEQTEILQTLLGSVAAGDRVAFEKLYSTCSLPLYRVILRILKRESTSQEALQEVFLKIWTNARQYNSAKASPMAWMSRIARNQAIDTKRYQRTRVDYELDDSEGTFKFLQELSAHTSPDNFGESEPILLCLAQLADQPRFCVVGAFCEGYSHEELSELTTSPIGTVKSWIRRSLKSLKRCLDEHI